MNSKNVFAHLKFYPNENNCAIFAQNLAFLFLNITELVKFIKNKVKTMKSRLLLSGECFFVLYFVKCTFKQFLRSLKIQICALGVTVKHTFLVKCFYGHFLCLFP